MSELFKTGGCGHLSDKFTCLECSEEERDKLKAALENMKWCMASEGKDRDWWKSRAEKMREALEKIVKAGTFHWKDSDAIHTEYWAQLAKAALAEEK